MLEKISFALIVLTIGVGCSAINPAVAQPSRAQNGAVAGGIAGAILGGIAGHQNDETPEGIAIGGAVGAIAGGLLGKSQEQQQRRNYQYQQQQYQQRAEVVSRAVSLNDAITMSRSGLSPNLIVSQIRTNGVQQRIGVQEVITLHENGVPEVVIQEMQDAHIAGTAAVRVARMPEPRPTIIVERPRPSIIIDTHPHHGNHYYHHGHHGYHHW